MPHVHVSRLTPRSYELDSYRHLNNGVYLGWFEQARLDWLVALGFSYDGFADRKEWFVVARTEVDFRKSVQLGQQIDVTTELVALGRSSVRFRQRMTHGDALCAEALTVMVFHGEAGSTPIPADFRAAAGFG
jgi:YbgC/YbaW family acyl-CoA thioester hydrolase